MSVMGRPHHPLAGLVLAFLWFAASSFAHAQMTHTIASFAAMDSHPALVVASESNAQLDGGDTVKSIIVDAAVFWDAVDHYEGHKEHSASCILSAPAIPSAHHASAMMPMAHTYAAPLATTFATRSVSPDTPPPRA